MVHKMGQISCLAQDLLASPEGIFSVVSLYRKELEAFVIVCVL